MRLTEHKTTQLYVLLNMFSQGMPTDFEMFRKDGPARQLAGRIAKEIAPYAEITITHLKIMNER